MIVISGKARNLRRWNTYKISPRKGVEMTIHYVRKVFSDRNDSKAQTSRRW